MNSDQKLRRAQLTQMADRAMTDTEEGMRDLMFAQIEKTPTARAYIFGAGPTPTAAELVDELWATPNGIALRGIIEDRQAETSAQANDPSAELERINNIADPAQRMNAARAAGLV